LRVKPFVLRTWRSNGPPVPPGANGIDVWNRCEPGRWELPDLKELPRFAREAGSPLRLRRRQQLRFPSLRRLRNRRGVLQTGPPSAGIEGVFLCPRIR
jgi:hypothetical protein